MPNDFARSFGRSKRAGYRHDRRLYRRRAKVIINIRSEEVMEDRFDGSSPYAYCLRVGVAGLTGGRSDLRPARGQDRGRTIDDVGMDLRLGVSGRVSGGGVQAGRAIQFAMTS